MNNNMDNQNNSNKSSKLNVTVKVLLITVIVLFLLSMVILGIRLGNFLDNGVDIFFIEPKEPGVTFGDDKQLWNGEAGIDIFEINNKNGEGKITVMSGNGDKVIAPGTSGYYKFNFKNIGNIAIDYNCNIKVSFETENFDFPLEDLPIKVKLRDYQGNYIMGSENTWNSIDALKDYSDFKTIGKNSYVYYELEWCWLFDSGNNELDTYLGNMSATSSVRLVIDLSATAVQSNILDAEGGIPLDGYDMRTGGDIVPLPYILLNVLIFIILVTVLIIKYIQRKEESKKVEEFINEPTTPDSN